MKPMSLLLSSSILLLSFGVNANESKPDKKAELTQEARQLVKQFAGQLKPKLKNALQTKGPVAAINICAEEAPIIAKTLSDKSGWEIKRVSLKARNASMATPNKWEAKQLKHFDAGTYVKQKNEMASLSKSEFKYMKAQKVEAVCLNCHGEAIAPKIQQALNKQFPDDKATGYKLGDIRGAFSLTKKL